MTSLNVRLESDLSDLDEVVVIGFGTSKKTDLKGSLISAPHKNFQEAPNTNILQSLNGSIPRVNIGQVERAGEDPSIRARGKTSLNANQNPLMFWMGFSLEAGFQI